MVKYVGSDNHEGMVSTGKLDTGSGKVSYVGSGNGTKNQSLCPEVGADKHVGKQSEVKAPTIAHGSKAGDASLNYSGQK